MVLQMAQELQAHIEAIRRGDSRGLQVPNSAKSRRVLVGKQKKSRDDLDIFDVNDNDAADRNHSEVPDVFADIDPLGSHSFGWRDFYDIAVKWRQLGEPFDTVFWIDCTAAQEDKHDKVGLQTFIHHGVGKNIRYYPYFDKTFALMKKLLPKGCKFYYVVKVAGV